MSKADVIRKIPYLIGIGNDVVATTYEGNFKKLVDRAAYMVYKVQAQSCISGIVGSSHIYARELNSPQMQENSLSNAKIVKGLLESLKRDLEDGFLQTLSEIVHADIFTDFVEMAEHLLEKGFKDAAAVIAGSVLEEHLRKLAEKNMLAVYFLDSEGRQRAKKSSLLNDELCKKNIYNKIVQKNVGAWQGLRNSAAHGLYTEYGLEDVRLMLSGVQNFLVEYKA